MIQDFLGFIQLEIIGIFDFLVQTHVNWSFFAPISHDMCVHTHAESILYIYYIIPFLGKCKNSYYRNKTTVYYLILEFKVNYSCTQTTKYEFMVPKMLTQMFIQLYNIFMS